MSCMGEYIIRCFPPQDLLALLSFYNVDCGADELGIAGQKGHVKLYMFDGDANDMLGRGSLSGATLTMDRNGVSNNAYLFDGAGDVIEARRPRRDLQHPAAPYYITRQHLTTAPCSTLEQLTAACSTRQHPAAPTGGVIEARFCLQRRPGSAERTAAALQRPARLRARRSAQAAADSTDITGAVCSRPVQAQPAQTAQTSQAFKL